MPPLRYTFAFAPSTFRDFATIERKHHSLIRQAIEEQLTFEPERETRNRKPRRETTVRGAAWELRCGPLNRFRVLYTVNQEAREVEVLGIGVKRGDRLHIAGSEVADE